MPISFISSSVKALIHRPRRFLAIGSALLGITASLIQTPVKGACESAKQQMWVAVWVAFVHFPILSPSPPPIFNQTYSIPILHLIITMVLLYCIEKYRLTKTIPFKVILVWKYHTFSEYFKYSATFQNLFEEELSWRIVQFLGLEFVNDKKMTIIGLSRRMLTDLITFA